MNIFSNTVVSLDYKLFDSDGELIEESYEPVVYLHGGYKGIFEKVEQALSDKKAGDKVSVTLEPVDAFGEYDSELVRVEAADAFPSEVEIGMQFEGSGKSGGVDYDGVVFTVTEVAEGKVVVDGNHPLAGQRLRFDATVTDVRPATQEEITHGHVHGPHGHHH